MTSVVNLRREAFDIYIGRAGKDQDGYFGNPFSGGTREENIEMFEAYFHIRLAEDEEFKRRVHLLTGKKLGCFCKPKACHGDVIVAYLEQHQERTAIVADQAHI